MTETRNDLEITQNDLEKVMAYSLEGGGKKIRSRLVKLAAGLKLAEGSAENWQMVDDFAAAVEMIHTYSLIQDDLPALDDDDWRRGQRAAHVEFGEAAAILASDGLLTAAAEKMTVIAQKAEDEKLRGRSLRAMLEVYRAVGTRGMLWGQWLDLQAEGKIVTGGSDESKIESEAIRSEKSKAEKEKLLLEIHAHKTGDLLRACGVAGIILAGGNEKEVAAIREMGRNLGLCFQITDDILDEVGSAEELGKTPGKDRASGKLTYVSLYGLEESRKLATEAAERARKELKIFGEKGQPLADLVTKILRRAN